jgi:hypothetical protein
MHAFYFSSRLTGAFFVELGTTAGQPRFALTRTADGGREAVAGPLLIQWTPPAAYRAHERRKADRRAAAWAAIGSAEG